jgi:hypothetical protein
MRMPLPTLEQQKVFERRIVAVQDHVASMARASIMIDSLFASLQYHAFAGKLTPSAAAATLASVQQQTSHPATALAV